MRPELTGRDGFWGDRTPAQLVFFRGAQRILYARPRPREFALVCASTAPNFRRVMRRRTINVLIFLAVLVFPAAAFGQATRTWVSGVGDDANPCSRTAPCKTFAGAISKTAAAGEIDVLDPGGFGAVTITKALTIDGGGFTAGVLVSGTNAIVVNAAATDRVTLRNLDMNGLGNGLSAVKVLAAKSVRVEKSEIYGFTTGVDIAPTGSTLAVVQDSAIHGNSGNGIWVHPPAGGTGALDVRRTDVDDNGCGAVASSTTSGPAATDCGTTSTDMAGRAALNIYDSSVSSNNGVGVLSNGSKAVSRVGGDTIDYNVFGLRALNGGQLVSFGDNRVSGNFVDGTATNTATTRSATKTAPRRAVRRRAKRVRRHARHHHKRHSAKRRTGRR